MHRIEKNSRFVLDKRLERGRKATRSVIALLCAAGLISCTAQDGGDSAGAPTLEQLESRIVAGATTPMDRESFGDTYAKLGAANFGKANDLTRWAAVAAAEDADVCDRVAMINVSDRSTRENVVWFVDCENGERVFIDQTQAEDARRRFGEAS